jgi:hypothetical protein
MFADVLRLVVVLVVEVHERALDVGQCLDLPLQRLADVVRLAQRHRFGQHCTQHTRTHARIYIYISKKNTEEDSFVMRVWLANKLYRFTNIDFDQETKREMKRTHSVDCQNLCTTNRHESEQNQARKSYKYFWRMIPTQIS